MNDGLLYVITGPTATGKTAKAVALAKFLDAEIVSADSRQIYRNMDLGTGKDLDEYGNIPYHLINICDAGYKYNLFEYLRDYRVAVENIEGRGKNVILCGGTGLYVESVLKGIELPAVPEDKPLRNELEHKSLDELTSILSEYKALHNVTDIDTVKRAARAIEIQKYYHEHPHLEIRTQPHPIKNAVLIGIDIDRDSRRDRITKRLYARLDAGMVDEVRGLIDKGVNPEDLMYYGLEYKFLTQYILGEMGYKEMVEKLETAIHQFAKRQMTWFRGMERRGFRIHWLSYDMDDDEFIASVMRIREEIETH